MTGADKDRFDAVDILRRLEPVLTGIEARLTAIEAQQRATGLALAGIDGQLKHMPSSLGITVTILIAVIANGAVMAGIILGVLSYAK